MKLIKNEHSVFQSLELIESSISKKLTVEYIASCVNFSKNHYQRLFREIVGDSVIMKMATQVDVFRWPGFKPTLDAMDAFMERLVEAEDFCRAIVVPREAEAPNADAHNADAHNADMQRFILDNIIFQCNVLLFHFRSEADKMGIRKAADSTILDDAKKASLKAIEGKINDCIQKALGTNEVTEFKAITNDIYTIIDDLYAVTKTIGAAGGALAILANEFRSLADKITEITKFRSLTNETAFVIEML